MYEFKSVLKRFFCKFLFLFTVNIEKISNGKINLMQGILNKSLDCWDQIGMI